MNMHCRPRVASVRPKSIQCSEKTTGPTAHGLSVSGRVNASPRERECDTRPVEEERRPIHEHRAQVDPRRRPGRKPARTLVMALPPFPVFEEADGHLGRLQAHVDALENHLGRVLPGLRAQPHASQALERDAAHAAMDVREVAARR